ncbi:MAG: hypothetical protein HQ555_10360 [Candidatus Aminicenantes bacterium]|nr:hypothetical protein [Candidatus Aminicenantes bacterium]
MKEQSVLSLKKEILATLKQEIERRTNVGQQSLVNSKVESRLAVGYSRYKKNDFRLELRVQRGEGKAFKEAEKFKTEARGEANIEIIPRIEIPSKNKILKSKVVQQSRKLRNYIRPLHIGLSIGHREGLAGTLGAFLEIDNNEYFLSNCHVLAPTTQAQITDPIFQPGRPDVKRLYAMNRVANLSDFSELAREERNEVDSAVALLPPDTKHSSNQIPKGIDCPMQGEMIIYKDDPGLLIKDKIVCKIGRTTGFTRGAISAISLDNVPVLTSIGNVIFDNVIEINWLSSRQPFSKPGDSGSLVFTEDRLIAIGLHFAGGMKISKGRKVGVSYSCSIRTILEDYKATLLGKI